MNRVNPAECGSVPVIVSIIIAFFDGSFDRFHQKISSLQVQLYSFKRYDARHEYFKFIAWELF